MPIMIVYSDAELVFNPDQQVDGVEGIQTNDNVDKRTRLLTLTESGWATLRAFQPAMNVATTLFKGD